MEHIAAILLVLGCSDDLSVCKELPAPTPIFETAQECDAILPSTMKSFVGKYPQIMAQCVAVDPANEDQDAELVWDIRPDGTLFAAVETPDVVVASNGSTPVH